jgi:SAM-dependent methyltransferase
MVKKVNWPSEIPQIERPYYSTVAFADFVSRCGGFLDATEVFDIGTGIGANLHYFVQVRPGVRFIGGDYNPEKVRQAEEVAAQRDAPLSFVTADWFNLPGEYRGRFDGIINIHTLCCFKDVAPAIDALCALEPRWIAFNSLFYEGPLDVLIHIRDHDNPAIGDANPDGDFNIFSLQEVRRVFGKHGYQVVAEPFYPPERLPRPAGGARGTYTASTEWHERTQFSGPVHLPWWFLFASK